jgi:hypothetical protein
LVVGHSTAGYSSQVFTIKTPSGVKVTPEAKQGAQAFVLWARHAPPGSRPRHRTPMVRERADSRVLTRRRARGARQAGTWPSRIASWPRLSRVGTTPSPRKCRT